MIDEAPQAWEAVVPDDPPADDLNQSGVWLVARHPRLLRLAARIAGVVEFDGERPALDLDHLSEVVAAQPGYQAAWTEYERQHRPPDDESEWERWRRAGPQPESFAVGLSDLLVMSSGERAAISLLAAFGREPTPFRASDLRSLDRGGARLLADWCRALQVMYGLDPESVAPCTLRHGRLAPPDSIPYWPVGSRALDR